MPRTRPEGDEDDDLPDGAYHDDPVTVPCPYCKADVYEDAEYCGKCQNYISAEDAPPARKPSWIWVGLILMLLLALVMAFR